MISHPDFRYDINALRAIAVVAVVLFHFQVPGFSGGFVGVDVFFVISGFLMTSIIVSALEAERPGGKVFSLAQFYLARARRILPALIVLVAVLLMLGWWVLPSIDYQQLAKQGVYALLFISNLRYQREAGYFDADSHEKWLLHTWSLSVEWQFYLLLPLLLVLVWRLKPGRKNLSLVMAAALLISLLYSIWQAQHNSSAAFFLLPSRAWQLLAGGLVYLWAAQIHARINARQAASVGLGLIVLSVVIYNSNSVWPGLAAVLPVAGTAMVLAAASQARWMQQPTVQWLGLSSYSLYLWHWPVVVSLVYMEGMGQGIVVAIGVMLSVLLGAMSYYGVENPVRKGLTLIGSGHLGQYGNAKAAAAIAVAALVVLIPARLIDTRDGISGRLSPEIEMVAAEARNFDPRRDECLASGGSDFPWCTYGGDDIRAVVVGDSHAASVFTAVLAAVSEQYADSSSDPHTNAGIRASAYNGCPTLFEARTLSNADECHAFNQFLLDQLSTLPADVPVIVVNRNSVYVHGEHLRTSSLNNNRPLASYGQLEPGSEQFLSTLADDLVNSSCRLAEQRQVYLIRPIPEMYVHVPKVMARQLVTGRVRPVRISRESYDERHAVAIAAQDRAVEECGVSIIDATEHFCDAQYCAGSRDGRPLYYDEDHLSEFGNRMLVDSWRISSE